MRNMGKSAVLKDLSGRPAGYMRIVQDGVMLRASLEEAAQMGLVFSDGSSQVYSLSAANCEQLICCDHSDVTGCFVFREEELLLISDNAARCAFERQLFGKREARQREADRTEQSERSERPEDSGEKRYVFAQPRWPPPPCWDTARYREGVWQEE